MDVDCRAKPQTLFAKTTSKEAARSSANGFADVKKDGGFSESS